jgi:hypothetical protein
MTDESDAEFDEDFGYSLRPADVERLLERARATGDREVRLLAKQHQALRRVAADLLAELEERRILPVEAAPVDSPGAVSYPIGLLRFLLRDEPRTPRT